MIADPGQPPTVSLARISLRRNEGTATAQPTPEAEDSETSLLDAIRIAQEADPFVADKQYQEQNSTAAEGAAPWATNHLSLCVVPGLPISRRIHPSVQSLYEPTTTLLRQVT